MSHRRCLPLLALVCLLVAAPAAQAGWYPSEPLDGPADIVQLGGVDIGRDGGGGVVYLRRDSGVAHVYISRVFDGQFRGPERVDNGVPEEATDAAIAAADANRLVVVWIAGNKVYGSFFPGGAPGAMSPPQLLTVASGPPTGLDVDMGINGTAYATFAYPGGGGSDVGAVRLQDSTWQMVPQQLDIDPANAAGAGSGRPRVAVSAEGNAVATWGEGGGIFARRITGLNISAAPQLVSAPGAAADSPDIDIEDDGSFAWVVWRQDVAGGSQTFARRLVGSQFETPAVIGSNAAGPSIAMDERGFGQAVSAAPDGTILASALEHDAFGPPAGVGNGDSPQVAVSERKDIATAWIFGAGQVAGRFRDGDAQLGPQTLLSTPAFGVVPAGAMRIGADRAGDTAVAMLQGDSGARLLTVAAYDQPPTAPFIYSSTRFQKRQRPLLKWRAGLDLWGTPTFNMIVDGKVAGTSHGPQAQPAAPLTEGVHRLRIQQVDRRGQTSLSRERVIRVDTVPPRLRIKLRGKRQRGSTLKLTATALDGHGSGVKYVEIDWGDKSKRVRATRASHRYRAGKFTLRVKAVDNVGNVSRRTVKLRIKK